MFNWNHEVNLLSAAYVCMCAWNISIDVKLVCTLMNFSCRGWMRGLAVIHQQKHCLSMVIWRMDAFVTYLPFQLQFFASFQLVEHGNRLSPELACRFAIAREVWISLFWLFPVLVLNGATQDCGSTPLAMALVASATYLDFLWILKGKGQLLIPLAFNWHFYFFPSSLIRIKWSVVFARPMHSTSQFDKTSLSMCVTHVGFGRMTWALRGIHF